jgi:hypothetical protein
MAHPVLKKVESGLSTAARVGDAAQNAYKVGKMLWQVGSTIVPPLAAMLL